MGSACVREEGVAVGTPSTAPGEDGDAEVVSVEVSEVDSDPLLVDELGGRGPTPPSAEEGNDVPDKVLQESGRGTGDDEPDDGRGNLDRGDGGDLDSEGGGQEGHADTEPGSPIVPPLRALPTGVPPILPAIQIPGAPPSLEGEDDDERSSSEDLPDEEDATNEASADADATNHKGAPPTLGYLYPQRVLRRKLVTGASGISEAGGTSWTQLHAAVPTDPTVVVVEAASNDSLSFSTRDNTPSSSPAGVRARKVTTYVYPPPQKNETRQDQLTMMRTQREIRERFITRTLQWTMHGFGCRPGSLAFDGDRPEGTFTPLEDEMDPWIIRSPRPSRTADG